MTGELAQQRDRSSTAAGGRTGRTDSTPHTGCAHRVRTPGAHTGCAHRVRTPGAHTGCAHRVRTPGAHTGCAHRVRTPGAHTLRSARTRHPRETWRDRCGRAGRAHGDRRERHDGRPRLEHAGGLWRAVDRRLPDRVAGRGRHDLAGRGGGHRQHRHDAQRHGAVGRDQPPLPRLGEKLRRHRQSLERRDRLQHPGDRRAVGDGPGPGRC